MQGRSISPRTTMGVVSPLGRVGISGGMDSAEALAKSLISPEKSQVQPPQQQQPPFYQQPQAAQELPPVQSIQRQAYPVPPVGKTDDYLVDIWKMLGVTFPIKFQ